MKATTGLKSTFHTAVREAIGYQDRWHLPAKIWLIREPADLWFEAHPDTVRPGGDSDILLELGADQLARLAAVDGTDMWDIEVNGLLDGVLSHA